MAGENASPPTYHITATLSATPLSALDNYIITNDGAEFTINKRLATWTTNPASKTYGDPDPSPLTTGSGTNFVAADNVTATYSRVAGENASPPTYHITATLSATPLSALDNYIITNDGAEFTINKRLATWTTNPASKTYGDARSVALNHRQRHKLRRRRQRHRDLQLVWLARTPVRRLITSPPRSAQHRSQRSTTTSSPTMAPSSPSINGSPPGPRIPPARPTVMPIRRR